MEEGLVIQLLFKWNQVPRSTLWHCLGSQDEGFNSVRLGTERLSVLRAPAEGPTLPPSEDGGRNIP